MNIEEYTQYHETKLHDQPGFSYNTYLCTIPLDFQRVDLHWHEQMEIIYVKKGAGLVYVGTQCYHVSAGYIVPVLPGELHAIETENGVTMEYENIIFSLSILDSTDENDWCHVNVIQALQQGTLQFPRPIAPGTEFHTQAAAALDAADQACSDKKRGFSLLIKSSLFQFLYALYTHRIQPAEPVSTEHEEVLKSVLLYVRGHFTDKIRISDAAAVTGYSDAHFMRFFKQETGRTFITYLTDYRLSYATYLLKESRDPISAVAAQCGFDNFSYFIRQFRRRYGMSPNVYRKKSITG